MYFALLPNPSVLTRAFYRFSYNTEQLDTARAPINMVHDNVALVISSEEAAKADDEAKRRLLSLKKLSLVVDLDQTVIHATVDPTVADWQKDEAHPNHNAVKDVQAFLLKDDGPEKKGCWYYIKLRPGLMDFLESISQLYECHIYTMGTRAYAKNIADIIDPQHKVFGDRILSRDENGSMTAKNLQRLFPVDTKMVVIIDDRGDVWKWSPNLIKVTPYDFFVGIGDINSSFLPKKPDPRPAPKITYVPAKKSNTDVGEEAAERREEPKTNGNNVKSAEPSPSEEPDSPIVSDASPLDQLMAMGGGDNTIMREAQTSSQEEMVMEQLKERPLLRKQLQLEAEDAATEAATAEDEPEAGSASSSMNTSSDSEKPKHNLLQDNDRELYHLERSLKKVHNEFFTSYENELASVAGGRLGKLRGGQKRKFSNTNSDLDLVPDIKNVLPAVKAKVLSGVVIVFSGVVPLGLDVGSTDIAILAKSFGGRIDENITRSTTHVVAARNRTLKVRKALKRGRGRIKIVNPQWLSDSVGSWERRDEIPYLLDIEESKNSHVDEDDDILSESESPATESGDETDSLASAQKNRSSLKPSLRINPPRSEAGDSERDVENELSPVDEAHFGGSPAGGDEDNWKAMNDEIADFLGSDAGEESDDGKSVASSDSRASSRVSVRGKKRVRDDGDSGGESDSSTRRKSKKKQNLGPGSGPGLTSLSQTSNVHFDDDERGANEGLGDYGDEGEEGPKEEGDGWDDFDEGDFDEELEKAANSEDQGEG